MFGLWAYEDALFFSLPPILSEKSSGYKSYVIWLCLGSGDSNSFHYTSSARTLPSDLTPYNQQLIIFKIYLFYVYECFTCMYKCAPCACCAPWRSEEGWNSLKTEVINGYVAIWVLGTELRTSVRARTVNYYAMTPAPKF